VSEGWQLDTIGNVVVVVTTRPLQPEEIQRIGDRADAAGAQGRMGYLHMLAPNDAAREPLSDKARKAFVDLVRRQQDKLVAAAIVIVREGFLGAAMRGAMTAIVMAARSPVPIKLFGDPADATRWLEQTMHKAKVVSPTAAVLNETLDFMHARAKAG